jgi:nucleotide-binding universal stress UspA family protein
MTLPRVDRAQVAAQLGQFIAPEQVPGIRIESQIEEAPHVHAEILVQADRLHADLVVIGTHGRSGFERLFLGSTAEKVLRKSRRPVMTVPPRAPEAMPRGPGAFSRVLCAVDFSTSSTIALEHALSLARQERSELTLVHVVELFPAYYDFAPPEALNLTAWTETARSQLRGMVPDSVRAECRMRDIVVTGTPYREILRLANDMEADLIVLGIQGRNAVDVFFFGSTAHHVVREARCAVLTLRESGAESTPQFSKPSPPETE